MESKKLQQMQQANTHLAPQQMPQPKQAPYHPNTGDYRPPHSPVFQSYPQYQSIQSNFAQINLTTYRQNEQSGTQTQHKSPSPPKSYQQSPPSSHSSHTLQSPTSPQHQQQMQEQKRIQKQQQQPQQAVQQSQNQNKSPPDQRQQQQRDQPMVQSPSAPNSATQSFAASFQFVQFPLKHAAQPPVDVTSYQGEQIYQTGNREKMYQSSNRNHFHPNNTHSHPTPQSVPPSQQQYQKSDKTQTEPHKTKTEALLKQQQQQSYALREHFNSSAAQQQQQQSHYHLNQGDPNSAGFHQQNSSSGSQPQRNNVPPSSLNITNQYQPSDGTQPAQPQQQPGDIHYGNGQSPPSMAQQQQPPQQQNPAFQQMVMHRHPPPPQQQQQPPPPPPHQHPHQPSQQQQQQPLQQQPQPPPPQQQQPITPQDWQNQIIIHQNHPNLVVNQACQTQLSGTASKLKSPSENSSSSQQTPTSATHPPLEKKKSSSQIQNLKSPITKRPQTAPITLSGWLYKQGSDGLKVWRKRWFVLSEYILYYYKAQEEEKLLGSILLPSYKVSACSPDDKIYRKFAFKCEHANMRTYWLAAENAELMGQWVRALTAATMMQGSSESDQVSQPSVSSLNHSGENSDSGIHTYQSQQSKLSVLGPLTPVSDSGGGGGPQPLYANAPPKPRRANDGGYSSPSPENSIDRYENNYDSFSRPHHDPSTPLGRRSDVKSPTLPNTNYGPSLREINSMQLIKTNEALLRMHQLRIENNKSPTATLRSQIRSPFQLEPTTPQPYPMSYSSEILDELYNANGDNIIRAPQSFNDDYNNQYYTEQQERELYLQHLLRQKQHLQQQQMKYVNQIAANNLNQMYSNAERRTPDTYGRSRAGYIQQMQQQQQQQAQQQFYDQYQGRHFSDYEDIYNLAQNATINQVGPGCAELGAYRRPMSPIGYDHRTGHIPNMPLRYTPNYLEPAAMQHVQMRARPVQAAIVPRPHSADFLEYEARNPENFHFQPEVVRAPRPKSSLDINRTPDSYYYSEESYAEKMRQSALYLQKHPSGKVSGGNNYNNNYQISSPEIDDAPMSQNESNTMPRESDYERALRLGLTVDYPPTQVASVPRVHRPNNKGGYSYQNDQFLRSASARLPRKDDELNGRDGERKREESMKRLLEWKQRMLQSPLTRKGAPLTIPNTVIKTPVQVEKDTLPVGLQRSRSETNANAGYNSYSSDDEDGPQKTAAGRSTASSSQSSPNNKSSCITLMNENETVTEKTSSEKSFIISNLESQSTPLTYTPVYAQNSLKPITILTTPSPITTHLLNDVVDDDSKLIESIENSNSNSETDENPEENLDINDDCNQKSADDDDDNETMFEYTEDDINEALEADGDVTKPYDDVKFPSINVTPVLEHPYEFYEGHYMPMTPKKCILNPSFSDTNIFIHAHNVPEENYYVEMTQNNTKSILSDSSPSLNFLQHDDAISSSNRSSINNANDALSNYEPVTINNQLNDTDSEPLYMELSTLQYMKHNNDDDINEADESVKNLLNNGKSTIKKSTLKKYNAEKMTHRKSRKMDRVNLPDILKQNVERLINSTGDSSDEDEEAIKKMENIKLKSRNRFSLSDTFRPASYYLGASTSGNTTLAECLDSSDSEIVSPPPIPSTPPSLDEFTSSFSPDTYNTIIKRDKHSTSNPILNLHQHKYEGHNSSRLSLPDQLHKYKSKNAPFETEYMSLSKYKIENESNYSFNTDDGSNTSSDYDLYNKIKLESPSFSDIMTKGHYQIGPLTDSESSDIELRHKSQMNEAERQKRRRPLSEDSFSEIDSLGSNYDDAMGSDLDQFLNNLQSNDSYVGYTDQTNWINDSISKIGFIKPPKVFCNDNETDTIEEEEEIVVETIPNSSDVSESSFRLGDLISTPTKLIPDNSISNAFYDSLEDKPAKNNVLYTVSPLKEQNLSLHDAACESEDLKAAMKLDLRTSIISSSKSEMDQQSTCTAFDLTQSVAPIHSRSNSNDQSAPYYYSDLISRNSNSSNNDLSSTGSLNHNHHQKLNNQRDIGLKRNSGIHHIHNPINRANKDETNALKYDNLEVGGRSISMEMLSEKKIHNLDHKNLIKNNIKFNYHHNSNNTSIKNLTSSTLQHRNNNNNNNSNNNIHNNNNNKTTAVENLIYSSNILLENANNPHNTSFSSNCSNNSNNAKITDASSGDQQWEEDTIWRESLRRVSHRHAKSLDDLDRIGPSPPKSNVNNVSSKIEKCDKEWGIINQKSMLPSQPKLKRDYTYVNDELNTLRKNYGKKNNVNVDDDNDVYVQLAVDDDNNDIYEVLRETDPTSNMPNFKIDRENLRHWDSMSTGLLKYNPNNSNNHNNNHNNNNSNNNNTSGALGILDKNNKRILGNGIKDGGTSSTTTTSPVTNSTKHNMGSTITSSTSKSYHIK